MADVDSLFNDFVDEHRSGGAADPRVFLSRADGVERTELAALIDGYLVRAPGSDWDTGSFEGSLAERWTEGMVHSLEGAGGSWPVLLPSLRERARIKRRGLVERLAQAIGVPTETERVAEYYHQMEQGQLESSGVSTRVLEALAEIVGSSAEALRQAGEVVWTGGATAEGTVFARIVLSDLASETLDSLPAAPASPGAPAENYPDEGERDEVDRLFTGGD